MTDSHCCQAIRHIQAGTLQMAVEVHELDTYAELASETIEITVE